MRPTLISIAITVSVWFGLFAWSVAATVYRDHQNLTSENKTLSAMNKELKKELELRPSTNELRDAKEAVRRLTDQLNDRTRQQRKADEYEPRLHTGRKIMVKWVGTTNIKETSEYSESYEAAEKWRTDVIRLLTCDFGTSVAGRFNLGKPTGIPLGMSEQLEHEARVLELERLMREMRSGSLHLRTLRNERCPEKP